MPQYKTHISCGAELWHSGKSYSKGKTTALWQIVSIVMYREFTSNDVSLQRIRFLAKLAGSEIICTPCHSAVLFQFQQDFHYATVEFNTARWVLTILYWSGVSEENTYLRIPEAHLWISPCKNHGYFVCPFFLLCLMWVSKVCHGVKVNLPALPDLESKNAPRRFSDSQT